MRYKLPSINALKNGAPNLLGKALHPLVETPQLLLAVDVDELLDTRIFDRVPRSMLPTPKIQCQDPVGMMVGMPTFEATTPEQLVRHVFPAFHPFLLLLRLFGRNRSVTVDHSRRVSSSL
jgi:hypothetical protein